MNRGKKDPRKAIERYHEKEFSDMQSLRENRQLKEDTSNPEKGAKVSNRLNERSERAKKVNLLHSIETMENIVSDAVKSESIGLDDLKKLNYEIEMFKEHFKE